MATLQKIWSEPNPDKEQMITELHEFVTDSKNDYALTTPVIVNTEDGKTLEVKYFARDIDRNDIFCMDKEWGDPYEGSIYVMRELTVESVRKIYKSIKSQEIDNGWDWREHAIDLLNELHPEIENEEFIFDFVGEYWMNLATDSENIAKFELTL